MLRKNNNGNESQPVNFYREKNIFGLDKPKDVQSRKRFDQDTRNLQKPKKIDQYKDYEFPTLLRRVQALFIDVIIILIIFLTSSFLIDFAGGAPNWLRGVILISMIYLYDPILISSIGGTIGHHIMKLRVRNIYDPNKNIFILNSIVRFSLKGLFGWLSFLTVTFNKRRRAIHDIASGSILIIYN